jgi:outer membrane protein assembly factor BamA
VLKKGIFLTLFIAAQYSIGQVISSINFEGLTKTKASYLTAIIESKVGQPYDSIFFENDIQRLRNLNLFFSVEGISKIESEDKTSLHFIIEEAVYIYPILSVGGFADQFKLQVGANQINFLGKAQSIGFLYQYYDRHSFSLFYTADRHSNNKTGHEVALTKYSTVEPLYFQDTVSNFNFDNYSVSLGGFYWLTNKIQAGIGGMYMFEKYHQLDEAEIGYIQDDFQFHKYQIRAVLNYKNVNQHFEFLDGLEAQIFGETIQTTSSAASFFKFTSTFSYFKRLGYRFNYGIRNKLGVSTNNNSPFSPFVLDGFLNLRGVGNRVARGTAIGIINTEIRFSFLRKKYLHAQLVGLVDVGSLRNPGSSISDLFEQQNIKMFTGVGIRLHSRYLYKSIFRLDYSINPNNIQKGQFTFGLGQFF